jgi:hypothetical protein
MARPTIARFAFCTAAASLATFGLGTTPAPAAEKLKPEEVLARHLEAVGDAEARAAARVVQGSVAMGTQAASVGVLAGRFGFDSQPGRFALQMQFPSDRYPAESFGLADDKADVGFVLTGRRSVLGNFVSTNPVILREGLLGGVLNAAWPLFSLAERGARLAYEAGKKLDGRELHRLRYRAKKGQADLEIFLYFEPDTFRHVASVYKASRAQTMGSVMEASSQQRDVYFQMEERFADWKAAQGLNLPSTWTIRYETQGQGTQYWKYDLLAETFGK